MSKVKLSEIGTFKNGLNFSAERVLSGCKMIGVPDFGDNYLAKLDGLKEVDEDIVSTDYLLQDNDILFVRSNGNKNLVGRAMLIEKIKGKVTFSGFCIRFRITNNNVNPLYMLYLFKSPLFRKLFSNTQQTSISNLNQEILGNIEVELPTIGQQNRIVKVIHGITRKIENNKRINDNLQQQAILLYDYWFTQFDFPDANGKPYYSSGNKMTWNNQLKKNIPLSWKVKPLKAICEICLGGTPSTTVSKYWNGSISWLNSGEIAQFPVVSSEKKITQLGLENSPTKLMSKNTTVISITGNIRASILALDACANQSVVGILENEIFKSPFIYQNMLRLLNHYTSISTGNCQKHISKGAIEESLVCIPDSIVLKQYYSLSEPIYKQMHEIALENQHLTELRDWLLPMLMNGQVTIKD